MDSATERIDAARTPALRLVYEASGSAPLSAQSMSGA